MNRNKTFCEECRRDVEYMVETATIKGKLKGEEYEYTGKKAICTECGSEVYVADIEDENLKALYDTYRRTDGRTIHDFDRRFQLEDEGFLNKNDKSFR